MSRFSEALESDRFLVTAELNPPKGTDVAPLLEKADSLKEMVDAFNLTDSHSSRMAMSPAAVAHLLADLGIESILQITCRDRNRIALQGDLLAAHALGASNVLCMSGDPPKNGDHPDAKPVFDIDAIGLLRAISSLQAGTDLGGNELKGVPAFCAGAVANPGADDLAKELGRLEEKLQAGAVFFQTQAVYDPSVFERFVKAVEQYEAPILAGFIMLKSAKMARNFNDNLPGVCVPEWIIKALDGAEDLGLTSEEIAGKVIEEIRPMCRGIHVMAIGWESRIPAVLERAWLLASA
jgi:5,10-methylenetetrahydrofolate reductase